MNINRLDRAMPDTNIRINNEAPASVTEASRNIMGDLSNKSLNYNSMGEEEKTKFDEQLKKLNESIASSGKQLHFKYNDEAQELYVEVINSQTQEVISSLPPEFLIDLSIKMKELVGMFFDKKI